MYHTPIINLILQGLSNYLTDLQFDAAEQDDLWQHLTVQGHKDNTLPLEMDVKTIMDTWTLQMGFPVVTVSRNYTHNSATVTQDRFLIGKSKEMNIDSKVYSWWIPLSFTGAEDSFENTYSKHWMEEGGATFWAVAEAVLQCFSLLAADLFFFLSNPNLAHRLSHMLKLFLR